MRLFTVSEENDVPSWTIATASLEESVNGKTVCTDQFNANEQIDQAEITTECGKIEQCASGGGDYYYNLSWGNNEVSHLREYAIACGMDMNKFQGVDAASVSLPTVEASSAKMTKVASNEPQENDQLQFALGDPFHLDERADTSHMDKSDWEEVTQASKMGDTPTMSGINAIRGGEDYSANSELPLPANQNSILNPDALDKLAEAAVEDVDTGIRLRNERAAAEAAKKQEHTDWQQGKIDAMEHRDIIPEGTVFQIAPEVANTGLDTRASMMANLHADDLPELTKGEQLKASAEERKASIQREVADTERTNDGKSAYRSISDDFSSSLQHLLKK